MRKYYDFLLFNKNCVASNCIKGIPARVRNSIEKSLYVLYHFYHCSGFTKRRKLQTKETV